ncbi:hypothetical protein IKF26_01545 [Candidatus Saccharibacteria bacterium]|nr:hypothetical protein [Candidatus Saccharibacteria bacterium]
MKNKPKELLLYLYLAGPAGYSSKTGRKKQKPRASSRFFFLGWTSRIRFGRSENESSLFDFL